jgi:DNA replication protein DnaD
MILPVGYLKLWRELFLKPIWTDSTPEQKVILITLLGMANFSDREWEWKGKGYRANRGEFVTSLRSIADNAGFGVTIKKVRTALERFENYGFLASQTTNRNRLITIVNWELYQSNEEERANKRASRGQAEGKQRATKEEGKEGKKERSSYISAQHLSMTKDEYDKLVSQYGKKTVDDKIEYAQNYRKLKNYVSLYRTLNNWLKADSDKQSDFSDYV